MKFNLYKSSHYAGRRTVETDLTAAGSRNRKNGELVGGFAPVHFLTIYRKLNISFPGFNKDSAPLPALQYAPQASVSKLCIHHTWFHLQRRQKCKSRYKYLAKFRFNVR